MKLRMCLKYVPFFLISIHVSLLPQAPSQPPRTIKTLKQCCFKHIFKSANDKYPYPFNILPQDLLEDLSDATDTRFQKISEKPILHTKHILALNRLLHLKPELATSHHKVLHTIVLKWHETVDMNQLEQLLVALMEHKQIDQEKLQKTIKAVIEKGSYDHKTNYFDLAEVLIDHGLQKNLSEYRYCLFSLPIAFCEPPIEDRIYSFMFKLVRYRPPQSSLTAALRRALFQVVVAKNAKFVPIISLYVQAGANATEVEPRYHKVLAKITSEADQYRKVLNQIKGKVN